MEENMKKYLVTVFVVLAMLAMFTGTVAAAPLASGTITLVSVVYVPGKGPVYTFEVSGNFSKSDLEGSLRIVGGGNFNLHCTKVDKATVKCTGPKKAAGKNVVVSWGGAAFSASVPKAVEKDAGYCYSVWDYWAFTGNVWTDFGPYCQDTPAQAFDIATYTVPDPGGSYPADVIFVDDANAAFCTSFYAGSAYYYYGC
jgi:hypothetical protein